ncbi:MAG: NAD(P)-dependent oxidoreductase [Rhodobacteraceae bacterium]|nr:NAD(P)-dependent oxidoreductase [Paracoccaceae bacterium]PHR54103.1 MAG: hypothetical protein COA47_15965 [Robiginitomaculum sp.]
MADISVLGLGLMGSALARTILKAGHDLAIWNRSPEKMKPLTDQGAICAPDLVSAIKASPIVLICVDNYTTARQFLSSNDVAQALSGRVVVQLSSSTPKEAQGFSDWMATLNVHYLDGVILAGPDDIGTDQATILLSGDEQAQSRAIGVLECLGDGTVRYLGPNVRAASALDLAWLTTRYGNFMSAIHASNICRSEGVGVDELIALLPDNPSLQSYAQVIHDQSFDEFTASLQVWGDALGHVQQQGIDAQINTEFPDFVASLFTRAMAAGHGQKNVMSLLKVMQNPNSKQA